MSRDALVVGINTYSHLPKLKAPADDAEAIAQRLRTQGEFRVWRSPEIIENQTPRVGKTVPVTLQQLKEGLARLFRPQGQHIPETALFYFSGHGYLDDSGFQEGYLATSDFNPATGNYGLSLQSLRQLLERSPVRQQVILLDCCHSGAYLSLTEANPGERGGTSRCFIAASRDFEAAYEDLGSSYSVLTKALLDGLDASGTGRVTSIDLTKHISDALAGVIQAPVCSYVGEPILLTFSSESTVSRAESFKLRSSPVPLQMPALPSHFVERPEHEQVLKEKLLCEDTKVNGTLVVSAIYGLGGIGKSVLAAKLAHDKAIQARFSDGILWVTLGQTPDILPLLGGWIQELGDRDYQPITVEGTSAHIRTLLYDKQMLLVVDDVWNPEHLEPFRVGGTSCCVLVTTREAKISGAQRYDLNVMTAEQSLELLTNHLTEPLTKLERQQALTFAERVGYLPLALELAAAQVEEGVTWSELLADFQEEVARLESLDVLGREAIAEDEKRRKYSLLACFNLSLKQLLPEQLRQFAWLGVLPEDVSISQEMTATLWQVTPRQAGSTLRQFRSKAILLAGAKQQGERPTYRLHDLMHDMAMRLLRTPPGASHIGNLPGLGLTLAEAHTTLLEQYRSKTQGGQWHTLQDDGYVYAHLTWHMEQAKCPDEVHRLLQEKNVAGRNGWYEACDATGKSAGFVNDLARAWTLASQKFEDSPIEALTLQWRYALIRASLNSLAQNIPPELIAALVKTQLWQPAQGLAYVQQTQNPSQRSQGIVQLIPYLPHTLFSDVLRIARQIKDEFPRAMVLSALAPHLPELWDEALEMTRQIKDEFPRARALNALAPHLPELWDEALKVTRQIKNESDRAMVLRALAPHLPELWDEALEVTRQIKDEFPRAMVLSALAPHLPELWDEALEVTRQIKDEFPRALVLRKLAPHLPQALLPQALEMTRQIKNESDRAMVLSALTPHLPELWDEALKVTRQIKNESDRARALRELAPHLPELWDEALEVTRQIKNESDRARALRELAPHLPQALLPQALEMTRQIRDPYFCAVGLAGFLERLPALGVNSALWTDTLNILACRERKELVEYFPKLRETVVLLGGEKALSEMVLVMQDVCRQWS